eukprot:scaffold48926_cov32-Tisochrysis_lutea.AAC.6
MIYDLTFNYRSTKCILGCDRARRRGSSLLWPPRRGRDGLNVAVYDSNVSRIFARDTVAQQLRAIAAGASASLESAIPGWRLGPTGPILIRVSYHVSRIVNQSVVACQHRSAREGRIKPERLEPHTISTSPLRTGVLS